MNDTQSKPNSHFHISGKRWNGNIYGNTYHSVEIFHDGSLIVRLPYQYGYGDQFLQTAIDWLKGNGYIDSPEYGTRYLRETLKSSYSVADVRRKGDL